MAYRIYEAIYRKNGISKRITLEDLDKQTYEEIYKGNLFCPNEECNARIVFASGEKVEDYFKTWRISQNDIDSDKNEHIEGCPYYVERDPAKRNAKRYDSNFLTSLTREHVERVLENAFRKHLNLKKSKKDIHDNVDTKTKKSKSRPTNKDVESDPIGKAGLIVDGAIHAGNRQPPIYGRRVEEISTKDVNGVFCVTGMLTEFHLDDSPSHVYLKGNMKKIKVVFNEDFIVRNESAFRNFHFIIKYDKHLRENKIESFCTCVGKVINEENEIKIIPEDYLAIKLNNLSLYQMYNELEKYYGKGLEYFE